MRFTRIYVSMFPKSHRTINRFVDPTISRPHYTQMFRRAEGYSWGTAYRSLAEWEAGEPCNLVAENACVVANCKGGADTKPVGISGWTTSPEHPIEIYNCVAYEGEVWDSEKYRMELDLEEE